MASLYDQKRTWRRPRTPTTQSTRAESERDGDSHHVIEAFSGRHKWLSNFSWSHLEFEGLLYASVEHAFQAAKLKTNDERRRWGFLDPALGFGEAKRLGRQVSLREDWKDIREDVMAACLRSKFADADLRAKLLGTGESELIDGHYGSPDLVWGYHYPSQAGENKLGKLLMSLRSELRDPSTAVRAVQAEGQPAAHELEAALYHLDWPMKCLHEGLPQAYAMRMRDLASCVGLVGCLVVLPRRKICIALRGTSASIDEWERRMRTEAVDVNSRGRPCRERMLVLLLRTTVAAASAAEATGLIQAEAADWCALCGQTARAVGLRECEVHAALGPEPPELPRSVVYRDNRAAVLLDGQRFALCLNDHDATCVPEALLGHAEQQSSRGEGCEVPLTCEGRTPNIFGGRFARKLENLLDLHECALLIELSENLGYGLAGSRGFNPFARFALRCLVDAPLVAAALTARLSALLPVEYPPDSGRPRIGVNQRLRFLKYFPGMHHSGDHTDCAHEEAGCGRSFLTVQLYLNASFRGGRTTFISDRLVPVEPTPGGAVVFDHELYHRGGQVTEGTKYAVRLDVLYGNPGGPRPSERASLESSPAMEASASLEHAGAFAPRRKGRWIKSGQAAA